MNRSTHRRRILVVLGALLAVLAIGGFASAASGDATTSVDQFRIDVAIRVRASDGYDRGAIIPIDTVPVPADWIDRECDVYFTSGNNTSIHPDNDIAVTTGEWQATIRNVETNPGGTFFASQLVRLGELVSIDLVLGESTIASLDGVVGFSCQPPPPDTTTTTTPDTTTTTSLPHIDTTTTMPPLCVRVSDVPGAALACEREPDLTG